MPRDFLFDIGNVILNFDFTVGVQRIQAHCDKVAGDEILATITDLTTDLESGRIDVANYVAQSSERIGYSGSQEDFIAAFEDIFTLNDPMVDLIEQLKQADHTLYLLSNTNGIHVPFFTKTYPVFELFSRASYSHEVRCMKPDAGIYQNAIEQFNLTAEHTIYIDDLEANIAAGKKSGLHGIHYMPENHSRLLDELRSLDIVLNG